MANRSEETRLRFDAGGGTSEGQEHIIDSGRRALVTRHRTDLEMTITYYI
jgi:hypothetical protein